MLNIGRRKFLMGASLGASSLLLSGCDTFDSVLGNDDAVRNILTKANDLTYRVHRLMISNTSLAQEFTEADILQPQRPNGITDPEDQDYRALAAANFADYKLEVAGLVDRPRSFSISELKTLPSRTQITRHDCVEGWSCIAKWTGTPLAAVLANVGVQENARFVMIDCFDTIEESLSGSLKYYESIDMVDAVHPQTILAWGMNGADLPIANGAPLRLRVERQLGYKMPKYIRKITLIDSFAAIGGGKGGYWEDNGYDWYGGI